MRLLYNLNDDHKKVRIVVLSFLKYISSFSNIKRTSKISMSDPLSPFFICVNFFFFTNLLSFTTLAFEVFGLKSILSAKYEHYKTLTYPLFEKEESPCHPYLKYKCTKDFGL